MSDVNSARKDKDLEIIKIGISELGDFRILNCKFGCVELFCFLIEGEINQ